MAFQHSKAEIKKMNRFFSDLCMIRHTQNGVRSLFFRLLLMFTVVTGHTVSRRVDFNV